MPKATCAAGVGAAVRQAAALWLPSAPASRCFPPPCHPGTWPLTHPPPPTRARAPAQFNELYEKAIDTSERASLPSKRIQNIIDHMTYEIYL